MIRLARCFPEYLSAAVSVPLTAVLMVYAVAANGLNGPDPSPPLASWAGGLGVTGCMVSVVALVFAFALGCDKRLLAKRVEKFKRSGKLRIVAETRGDWVRIMKYGGGIYHDEIGRFHGLRDAEAAIECAAEARSDLRDQQQRKDGYEREAQNLARILNR